nr:MAG TPA: hypothetical protein [Caudoviricetes sp.]
MNLAISPLLTLLATDATINPHCKYREQIENNKIKQQQNGKTKEIRLRFR